MSRINRISAWILMACFILYMLSGLDTQRRVLIPQLSSLVHLKYLFIPAQSAFTYHSSFAIHLALKRWDLWSSASKVILSFYILANLALIGFYIYAQ